MLGQVRLLIAAAAAIGGACETSPRDPTSAAIGRTGAAMRAGVPAGSGSGDYSVDVSDVDPPCRAGASCAIRLRLVALGVYKINAEYPIKFVTADSPGVIHEASGPFQTVDLHTGTLDVRFRAPAAGSVKVTGTYKTAICTDEVCHINDVAIAHDVTVVAAEP